MLRAYHDQIRTYSISSYIKSVDIFYDTLCTYLPHRIIEEDKLSTNFALFLTHPFGKANPRLNDYLEIGPKSTFDVVWLADRKGISANRTPSDRNISSFFGFRTHSISLQMETQSTLDDYLGGSPDQRAAFLLIKQIVDMRITKWISNVPG